MKITDLDKKIIEYIEPYMDKTLSFGCIFEWQEDLYILVKNHGDYVETWEYDEYETRRQASLPEGSEVDYKILGHYDITAVLKYIQYTDNVRKYEIVSLASKIKIEIWLQNGDFIIGSISNKPLHLYSEQEKKDLLELLENLCKK